MADNVAKKSEILLKVEMDENRIPVNINWTAEDGGVKEEETTALLLSLWDPKDQTAMRIDLWHKDFSVDEMKMFFHQTLSTMADTFERATGEDKICADLRDYCDHFADKMNLNIPGEEK